MDILLTFFIVKTEAKKLLSIKTISLLLSTNLHLKKDLYGLSII